MTKFNLDNVDHELETLSKDAKGHAHAIQFIDAQLHKLIMEQAALQTARTIYANAFREAIAGADSSSDEIRH